VDDSKIKLLTFEIWHERFGIPLTDVREIVRAVSIVRLPKAPPVVEGIIDGLLLIHDLSTFLSATEAEALDRLEEQMPL
jgi:chemotaxis signal transduction protein